MSCRAFGVRAGAGDVVAGVRQRVARAAVAQRRVVRVAEERVDRRRAEEPHVAPRGLAAGQVVTPWIRLALRNIVTELVRYVSPIAGRLPSGERNW